MGSMWLGKRWAPRSPGLRSVQMCPGSTWRNRSTRRCSCPQCKCCWCSRSSPGLRWPRRAGLRAHLWAAGPGTGLVSPSGTLRVPSSVPPSGRKCSPSRSNGSRCRRKWSRACSRQPRSRRTAPEGQQRMGRSGAASRTQTTETRWAGRMAPRTATSWPAPRTATSWTAPRTAPSWTAPQTARGCRSRCSGKRSPAGPLDSGSSRR